MIPDLTECVAWSFSKSNANDIIHMSYLIYQLNDKGG